MLIDALSGKLRFLEKRLEEDSSQQVSPYTCIKSMPVRSRWPLWSTALAERQSASLMGRGVRTLAARTLFIEDFSEPFCLPAVNAPHKPGRHIVQLARPTGL